MLRYFTGVYGNAASRTHMYGWQAAEAVTLAREQVAALIGAETQEIVFTSGATEAVNLAIKGVAEAYRSKGNHIITAATEHKAVLDTCHHLEKLGYSVTSLPVNAEGLVDPVQLEAAITPATILVAIMFANNETGTLQPVSLIGEIARKKGVLFFTDATQAVGKIPVQVNDNHIDLMAFSAHKLYGPKGVGALYLRRKNPRVNIVAQMDGGGHERGKRSGTLNVPGIVGFGKACSVAAGLLQKESLRLLALRNQLETNLLALGDTSINGSKENRLPQVSNLTFKFAEGEALMLGFAKEIALSSGSSCSSASMEPSHVLKAMGLSDDLAYSSLRFSLGRFTTEEEIKFVTSRVKSAVENQRALAIGQ